MKATGPSLASKSSMNTTKQSFLNVMELLDRQSMMSTQTCGAKNRSSSVTNKEQVTSVLQEMQANNAKLMARGLNYKFKLQDLSKYSQTLRFTDINWVLSQRGHEMTEEELRMVREQEQFDKDMQSLLLEFKNTDWESTPLYEIYKEHGHWVYKNDDIYSEIEAKYLASSICNMFEKRNYKEEFRKVEGAAFIK